VFTAGREALEFTLLGPVEARRGGRSIALGGPRQRALLALLLLEPGRPVSAERLADELWHGRPPAGAAATLRSYVSRLRAALGDGDLVTGGPAGYGLAVAADAVDSTRFVGLAREGAEALARGAAALAAERLRGALALWRGAAFDGTGGEGALAAEAVRLEELRLLALEDRIEADLALGDGAVLVDELEALLRANPYRERLWASLMLALYRAGRQADALDAFRRARALLDEQLGLEPGEELRRLEQAILRHEVPPPSAAAGPAGLPLPLTSFVGREPELAEVERLLGDARLVTLTGVGGVGKTRLALEAAARALDAGAGDVHVADLSGLSDPDHAAPHVASAVGVRELGGRPIGELLAARLRDVPVLLVLDNCEHVLAAAAALAEDLLVECRRLRVLATSRVPLGVPGEVDLAVQPLELPGEAAEHDAPPADAVRLFLDRARAARPGLVEDAAARATAERICRDLDGLPLAIELAAARAKALSLGEIAARLGDRFRFLVSWRRLSPARHRTLREAMDWSHELLDAEERTLFACLSVFSGGFALEAAAAVCLDGDDGRAVELVGRLVDASLVVADERAGAMRYRLLETVRQYGAERLAAGGEGAITALGHARWYVELAERAEPELTGAKQVEWFAALEVEHDNLRAALRFLADARERDLQLRLTVALTRFWYVRGYLTEARGWLAQALAQEGGGPAEQRRRALTAAAALALLQGDYAVSTAFAEESLSLARAGGEGRLVANALSNLGAIVLAGGDHERAATLLEEAVALARSVGDDRIAALAINNLGDLALTVADYDRAGPLFAESLELLRARGDTSNVARALFNLGAVALMVGRTADAEARLREAVELGRVAGDKEDLAWCLVGFAALAAARGDGERGATLLGAAGSVLREMGAAFKPFERQLHDGTEAMAASLCDPSHFAGATAAGAALSLHAALEYALEAGA
jgi:predicted ATPase/DNA-binding SARP family transcriptional activator